MEEQQAHKRHLFVSPHTMLCRMVASDQEKRIFRTHPEHMELAHEPEGYEQLKGMGVKSIRLPVGEDSIVVWEKQAQAGKPHFILYHGNTGHWGDAGAEHLQTPGYDRHAYLNFLKAVGDTGAGFTAVHLRGYGGSTGMPSEKAFCEDADVVIQHVLNQKHIPRESIGVAAISMGTAVAAITAEKMTELGEPPAFLGLCNPFSSMTRIGTEILNKQKMARLAHIHVSQDLVAQYLRHPFDTKTRMGKLDAHTYVYIYNGDADTFIDPSHGTELAEAARANKKNLHVERKLGKGYEHYVIPCEEIVQDMLRICQESRHAAATENWVETVQKRGGQLKKIEGGAVNLNTLMNQKNILSGRQGLAS